MVKPGKKCTILIVGIGILLLSWVTLTAKTESPKDDIYQQLKLFSDVLNLVQDQYVEKVDSEELVRGAVNGMLRALDPHSSFLTPEDYKELQIETKGKFGGIGIEITVRDNVLTVVAPLEGTPADTAGIQSNDKIIKIDGELTQDMSLMEAVQKMRGPKGTKVKLTILRQGEKKPLEFELTRAIIAIRSVRTQPLEPGYGYVRISSFQSGTDTDLQKILDKLENDNRPLRGILLDLRNNPGGLLDQAVAVSDEFLDKGLIVYTGGRLESQKMTFDAVKNDKPRNYPIVVLINGGSASAAEIVAGALQDHKRALVLGERSFGKGSVQTVIPLNNGYAVRLTTSLYYTPSGRSIQATGIEPDIAVKREIPRDDDGEPAPTGVRIREQNLPRHMERPTGDEATEPRPKEEPGRPAEDWVQKDNQVKRALDLLKSYEIMHKMHFN